MKRLKRLLEGVTASALATNGPHGLNVVPVSVVELRGEEIHLYDFFMCKTAENVLKEPMVALTCWSGFAGLQIKAEAIYDAASYVYNEAVIEMKERFPDRTLRAVIRLKPTSAYDISPTSSGENLLTK